jgi:hypothetical protein
MTVASGTRRGSALNTPSTSVQMWISEAFSTSPKIDAEKSEPLRPSVVCTPSGVRAMKPGMIRVSLDSAGISAAARCRDTGHCTPGPSGPQCTWTTSRASSQRTVPRLPREARLLANSRVDHSSPYPATTSRVSGVADPAAATARRRCSMSAASASNAAAKLVTSSGTHISVAMSMCRCRMAARAGAVGSRRSDADTRSSRPSVTPLHADRMTANGPAGSASMMSATRRMQAASATLDPPNLNTRHELPMTP